MLWYDGGCCCGGDFGDDGVGGDGDGDGGDGVCDGTFQKNKSVVVVAIHV